MTKKENKTQKKYVLIHLNNEEILEHPFVNKDGEASFYRYITECFGVKWGETDIDCRLIDVSPDIQDTWYSYAKENAISTLSLTMTLAMSGPKALSEIPEKTVRIWEGCFSNEAIGLFDWKKKKEEVLA